MIRTFGHKGLKRFFEMSDARAIPGIHRDRVARMLDRLDAAIRPQDMNVPGWRLYPLRGERAGRWAVAVSGNLRLTFGFDGEDAIDVALEDYH